MIITSIRSVWTVGQSHWCRPVDSCSSEFVIFIPVVMQLILFCKWIKTKNSSENNIFLQQDKRRQFYCYSVFLYTDSKGYLLCIYDVYYHIVLLHMNQYYFKCWN